MYVSCILMDAVGLHPGQKRSSASTLPIFSSPAAAKALTDHATTIGSGKSPPDRNDHSMQEAPSASLTLPTITPVTKSETLQANVLEKEEYIPNNAMTMYNPMVNSVMFPSA
jgi:hypothetical protein